MPTDFPEVRAAIDALCTAYDASVENLRDAIRRYVETGTRPTAEARAAGCFAYPELRIEYADGFVPPPLSRAYARLIHPGVYASSIARPALFHDYLTEQLDHLVSDYGAKISVGPSASEIPYPYVLDGSGLSLGDIAPAELARHFPSTELVHIGDEVLDGLLQGVGGELQIGRKRANLGVELRQGDAEPVGHRADPFEIAGTISRSPQ